MNALSNTPAFALATTIALSAGAAAAGNQPTHCADYQFAYVDAASIQATCVNADGVPVTVTAPLPGIENLNGRLVLAAGRSSFQQTCGAIAVKATPDGLTLSASCHQARGEYVPSEIALPGFREAMAGLAY